MTHTPGPWTVAKWLYEGQVPVVADGEAPVAGVKCWHWKQETIKANARLIAAAPDLLSAAQAMLAKLENLTVAEFERGGERAERDALAKAIAKACQS